MIVFRTTLFLCLCCALMSAGDLAKVMAEPNLERRSEKAWQNAGTALDEARKAFQSGDADGEKKAMEEVLTSVNLTKKSLDDSGKNPRKNSKYFRRAEIGLRSLIRRLDTFRDEHPFDERGPLEKLIQQAEKLRSELLLSVMEKK